MQDTIETTSLLYRPIKSDSLQEELLMTEANYYQTFGMTDKSLECYNILFQKRSTGKDEKE